MKTTNKNLLKFIVFLTGAGLLVLLSLVFFPFVVGSVLGYIAYKKIKNKKLRNPVVGTIFFFTLLFVLIWLEGFSNNPSVNQPLTQQESSQSAKEKDEGVLVTRVIDGDTIEIETGQKVRYIGIDTPETVDPQKPVQCFGKEASSKNSDLVLNKRVRLEKDVSETDQYGRLLRYVYVGDTFVNDYLVREGYAHISTFPPDVKYQSQFLAAEQEARKNNRGLWSVCVK